MLPASCRILPRRAGRGKDQAWLNGIATPVPGKIAHLEFDGFCRTSVEYFLAGHVIRTFAVERAVGIIGCDTLLSTSLLLQTGIQLALIDEEGKESAPLVLLDELAYGLLGLLPRFVKPIIHLIDFMPAVAVPLAAANFRRFQLKNLHDLIFSFWSDPCGMSACRNRGCHGECRRLFPRAGRSARPVR